MAIAPTPAETKPPAPVPARIGRRPRAPPPAAAPVAPRRRAPEPAAECGGVRPHELLQQHQRAERQQRGQCPVGLLELELEGLAARAGPQVAANERARPLAQPLGDLAELDPDLVAGEQPRLGGLGERHARAHEQRLDARHRRLHRLGDLLVGERVHLPQHQRGLLGLRQLVDVADEQPELLALVDHVGGGLAVVGEMDVHRVDADRLGPAQLVEAPVAGDPVQPRLDVDRPLVGEHRVVGRRQHLLQDVLGVLPGAEHVAAERQQARLVAGDEHLERRRVASADERDQPLVGLQAEQRRAGVQADSPGIFES